MNNHNFAGIVVCYHGAFNVLPKRRLDRQTTSHHIIHTACYYLHCLFLLRNTNPSPRREEWRKEKNTTLALFVYTSAVFFLLSASLRHSLHQRCHRRIHNSRENTHTHTHTHTQSSQSLYTEGFTSDKRSAFPRVSFCSLLTTTEMQSFFDNKDLRVIAMKKPGIAWRKQTLTHRVRSAKPQKKAASNQNARGRRRRRRSGGTGGI